MLHPAALRAALAGCSESELGPQASLRRRGWTCPHRFTCGTGILAGQRRSLPGRSVEDSRPLRAAPRNHYIDQGKVTLKGNARDQSIVRYRRKRILQISQTDVLSRKSNQLVTTSLVANVHRSWARTPNRLGHSVSPNSWSAACPRLPARSAVFDGSFSLLRQRVSLGAEGSRAAESRDVRPPDCCRVLPWKITVQSGAKRRRKDASVASALDGDLCAARGCPAARRTARPVHAGAVTVSALRRGPSACGCGAADRRQRRARWAPALRARQAAAPEIGELPRRPRGLRAALPHARSRISRGGAASLMRSGPCPARLARRRRALSRPGARCRDCSRSVSPDLSPNPPCASRRNGLSTVSAVRWVA